MFHGLRVAGKTGLCPTPLYPNSGTFVFPRITASAAFNLSTTTSSSSGTKSRYACEPETVLMSFVQMRSLTATGTPASGPTSCPLAIADSTRRAVCRARSGEGVQ